jgi:hypothetical protein
LHVWCDMREKKANLDDKNSDSMDNSTNSDINSNINGNNSDTIEANKNKTLIMNDKKENLNDTNVFKYLPNFHRVEADRHNVEEDEKASWPLWDDGGFGGGWLVVLRRGQFGQEQDYFVRGWNDYFHGFGHVDGELWIGLDNMQVCLPPKWSFPSFH